MDRSLPGSSIYGIFQARVLEWGAIAFSICELELSIFKWEIKISYLNTFFHLNNIFMKNNIFQKKIYREKWH